MSDRGKTYIQHMIERADQLAQLARFSRSGAVQARGDARQMRAEIRSQLDILGREEGFRRRYVAAMLPMILARVVDNAGAEMGNIQVCDDHGLLQICAHHGFDHNFLQFFGVVHLGEAACGLALRTAERVIVPDVTNSPVFCRRPILEALLDAGVRSVQSTPLRSKAGRVLGMLSTHSSRVKVPTASELARIDHFARWAASLLQWKEQGATGLAVP